MGRLTATTILLALALLPATAVAGQIWTDGNGDGLADPSTPFSVDVNDVVTVRVFFDSQSYTWTNYQAWISESPGLIFQSAQYLISGGTNFPLDRASCPNWTGFAGIGFSGQQGVALVGSISYQVDVSSPTFVQPEIDEDHACGVFSVLGAESSYSLFESAEGTHWQNSVGTEPRTWGQIKSIYQ